MYAIATLKKNKEIWKGFIEKAEPELDPKELQIYFLIVVGERGGDGRNYRNYRETGRLRGQVGGGLDSQTSQELGLSGSSP